MTTPWPTCVLPTCRTPQGPAREQVDGGLLCWPCAERLRSRLREIDAFLELPPLPRRSGLVGRRSPGYGSRPPVNLDLLVMGDPRSRDEDEDGDVEPAAAVLLDWARYVRAQCQDAHGRPLTRASDAIILLLIHNRWIAAQPWVPTYVEAVGIVARAVRGAAGDRGPAPIGVCTECRGAPVMPVERTHTGEDGRTHRRGGARCTGCGAAYDGMELVRFRLAQEAT